MAPCRMYLLRHGATDNNLAQPPRLQGCGLDADLSHEGRRQAEQVRQFLGDVPLAAIFSSPLRRALQTAEIVAQPHSHTVQLVETLREVDVGLWEGRSWNEIAANDSEAYALFRHDPSVHPYAGGENLLQVQQRVTPALAELALAHLGRQIVVVAHNVVNRAFIAGLLQLPLAEAHRIRQDNCGINLLEWESGQCKLRTWNSAWHLE
jgi:broad specificity phosphatase PhoE